MDKRFLDKVLGQIVSETRIDYEKEKVYTPFSYPHPAFTSGPFHHIFFKHCREVYGLNEDEIEYVWEEYKYIYRYYG
jgi:hypothetical protein